MHRRSRAAPVSLAAIALGAAGAVAFAAPSAQEVPAYSAVAGILSALAATPTPAPATSALRQVTAAGAAWLSSPSTDACSGASFDLAGFAGKTVPVHPMATW